MRLEGERLDAVGHELGMPGDGCEAQVRRNERKPAQQIQQIGLLARAVAAEHVRVEHDHASSS